MKKPLYPFDYTTGSGQKKLMYRSMGRDIDPDATVDVMAKGDYGSDPLGDGKFRMVPSGDIVNKEERDRRSKKYHQENFKVNKSQRLISLIEKSKYVQRLPRDFTIFLELNAPADYEGMNDYAEVALAVEAEWERPDISVGWQGGWSINSVEISKDFKFMGTLYKAQAVFPIGLIEYAPKFSKIDDIERRKKSFEDWVSSEVEESAGKRKGGM